MVYDTIKYQLYGQLCINDEHIMQYIALKTMSNFHASKRGYIPAPSQGISQVWNTMIYLQKWRENININLKFILLKIVYVPYRKLVTVLVNIFFKSGNHK